MDWDPTAPRYRDLDRSRVVVACMPDGPYDPRRIWFRRFIGVKAGDNPDGTIRVQVYGPAEDLRQSVFRRD